MLRDERDGRDGRREAAVAHGKTLTSRSGRAIRSRDLPTEYCENCIADRERDPADLEISHCTAYRVQRILITNLSEYMNLVSQRESPERQSVCTHGLVIDS